MAAKKKNNRRTTRARRTSSPVRVTPAFVTPMAAQVVKRLPEGGVWVYELKFDGYRALVIKDRERVEVRSRKTKDLTGRTRDSRRRASSSTPIRRSWTARSSHPMCTGRPSFQGLHHSLSSRVPDRVRAPQITRAADA